MGDVSAGSIVADDWEVVKEQKTAEGEVVDYCYHDFELRFKSNLMPPIGAKVTVTWEE